MEAGIYSGISNEDYHGGVGVSKSGLDLIAKAPLHYWAAKNTANDNAPTVAQAIGSAFHTLVLEPHLFNEQYVLPMVAPVGALDTIDDLKAALKDAGEKVSGTKPELIERLKAVRPDAVILADLKQQYAITNAGRTIMTADAWMQLEAMRDALMAHPAAGALFRRKGKAEQSVYWTDPVTGELCRCRPDFWPDGLIVDLKTTEDASVEGFAKSIAGWRYHVQAPMYLDGVNHAIDQAQLDVPKVTQFIFVAVEKKFPHAVGVYVLDQDSMDIGRAQYHADLAIYAECKATDTWPGYGDKIQPISLPAWQINKSAHLLVAA